MTPLEQPSPATEQGLWDALTRARSAQMARERARAEVALFRHYRPLARELARSQAGPSIGFDREGADQAAEIALARAILDWDGPQAPRFEAYARLTITRELRSFGWRTRGAAPIGSV